MHCECDSAEIHDDHRKYRERSIEMLFWHNTTAQDLHMRWRQDIVGFYTRRKLTRSSDKIIALSAIAESFQTKLKSKYLVGLWEQDLILDMLWSAGDPGLRESYQVPTWSWVACAGWTYYPLLIQHNVVRLATLISFHISHTTSGPPGIPDFGSVILRGKLARVTIKHEPSAEIRSQSGPFKVDVLDYKGLTSWIANPDIFPPTLSGHSTCCGTTDVWHPGQLKGHLYFVRVLFMPFYPEERCLYGIILIPSPQRHPAYNRMGIVMFYLRYKYDDIKKALHLWDDEHITIT
ncbi:uncharacterized protein F4822DRAFT_373069 [Hypoxylon trugodes]|uniref:uncharacterized protein n=1 Tax=Hypoxylon trugodes TaxID=326681 RepID=UPI00219D59F1|nr:uncharacterized protein F4822DRAFT_373069 [Hypoxylon trugodes]KAI1384774.1 hypothetical protein F4822DRAFT_373069 [Hypoxylon trugodes]